MQALKDFDGRIAARPGLSLAQYGSELAKWGQRTVRGERGTLWVRTETVAMLRFPVFDLAPPSLQELSRALWSGPAAIATHLLNPDDTHPANAYLYVCRDKAYALDKLAPPMRRNVRRGLRELEIAPLTVEDLLDHGYEPYLDWLRRSGLRQQTGDEFRRLFTKRSSCRAHVFWGAWKDRKLASFLSVTELDQWVEIDGCFSAGSMLHLRPNDALFFSVLSNYMNEDRCHTVSYGVSSVQLDSNRDGLHAFKTKVGFDAVPVHRAFVLHPVARIFANRLVLGSIKLALRFRSGDRRLKKAEGSLACILGKANNSPKPEA